MDLKVENEVSAVEGVHMTHAGICKLSGVSFCGGQQSVPFTHKHIPPANITPQKRKLPDYRVCTVHQGSSYPVAVNSKSTLEFRRRAVQ